MTRVFVDDDETFESALRRFNKMILGDRVLAEVLPREGDALVQHRPDRYGGVDYNSLIAPLVLAVQQLAARVQQLESA